MEIEGNDRKLFMKYALPCAGTLIKRGKVSREYIESLIEIVKGNREVPEDAEKIFSVAFAACSLIAIDKGKKKIDSDIVREYFLFRHNDVIDKRYSEMGDFDPEACRTRAGVVKSVNGNSAIVKNLHGEISYHIHFLPNVKEKDIVATHWNFVIERIDKKTEEKMKKSMLVVGVVS